MSGSLLFTDNDDTDNLDISSNPIHSSRELTEEEKQDEQVNIWSRLSLTENHSFFTIIKRLCIYWHRILLNKIRLIFTLIFMSMLNITARIACFTRRQAPSSSPSSSSASFNSLAISSSSSSTGTLEEDSNDSSTPLLFIDKTHKQPIHLPSLQNSKMAHMLVQQQTHRSPNISIHRSVSSQKDSTLPMSHSVDDRLFSNDSSTRLLHLLTRFASDPHMSQHNIQSTNTNGYISKSPVVFALSSPISEPCLKLNESDNHEIHFLSCDKIQPVSTSKTEDLECDKIDNIKLTTIEPLSEQVTAINTDSKSQQLDEDIQLDSSPTINGNDMNTERHFRRRKRRSSLTKNSFSLDDTSPTINLLETFNINQTESPELKQNDDKQDVNIIETKPSTNEEINETTVTEESPTSVSRYRGRRLRHRFYRQSASASSPQEVSPISPPDFYLANEALNIETTRTYSPSQSPPITISPLASSISPTLTIVSHNKVTPNGSTGGLKRTNSTGTTKKNVRFADTVGRELTQVQYINSKLHDETKEFSFLLGSSLLSSSPPSFTKNNLYIPNTSRLEHKPWSFDVALAPKLSMKETSFPKRFFCLYRQPNSEHPDIYLHEIWKSQIKLEYADIPLKCSLSGIQQLMGTLWVTNASYWKNVTIKYTFNRWLNTYEREAQHRCHSNDYRNIDQFEFFIDIPEDVDRIDFVLRYCVNGQEHWDNNEGKNYTLQTEAAYTPSTIISLPHDCDFNEMRFY
ncbi:unnamed protein product [Adineta steineri]|uniref:CBM21 domain-containing protein n=2 Tax=Adineta steineri TaxID=433720 RepID=A0A818FQX1_9BILA|nr:unnamed protein product [Adineta steineri]